MKSINPRFLILVVVATILMIVWVYVREGGLDVLKVKESEMPSFSVVGKAYQGGSRDEALRGLIEEIYMLNKKGELPGTPVIVFYGNPADTKTTIRILVGVVPKESMEPPAQMETFFVEGGNVVEATVNQEVLMTPEPKEIEEKMQELATQKGYELQPVLVEFYEGKEKRVVVPIKE